MLKNFNSGYFLSGGDNMKYKIEKLDDSSVVYMRMIGTYQSDKTLK